MWLARVDARLKPFITSFLNCHYSWPKWCYFVLRGAYKWQPLFFFCLNAPSSHSLVHSLRTEYRCRFKVGVTFRPTYLMSELKLTCGYLPDVTRGNSFQGVPNPKYNLVLMSQVLDKIPHNPTNKEMYSCSCKIPMYFHVIKGFFTSWTTKLFHVKWPFSMVTLSLPVLWKIQL